jgi:hypothetical protein
MEKVCEIVPDNKNIFESINRFDAFVNKNVTMFIIEIGDNWLKVQYLGDINQPDFVEQVYNINPELNNYYKDSTGKVFRPKFKYTVNKLN